MKTIQPSTVIYNVEPLTISAPDAAEKEKAGIGIHVVPATRYGKVKGPKVTSKRKLGRKLSKLAMASPAVVRSTDEQRKHERLCQLALQKLAERRSKIRSERRHNVTLALRKLTLPMFGIVVEGYAMFVSANVLSDYKREGVDVEVTSMPVIHRLGRIAGVRARDIDLAYVEQFAASRANDHAMGMAQNAWRYAHCEGDKDAERVAYHWLYHGNLKPCKDPHCKACESDRKRRLQALEIHALAFRYLELDMVDRRSNFNGSRTQHRMKALPQSEGLTSYAAESYDEMRERLHMA